MTTFGERLHTAVQEKGPLCAGIDPGRKTLEDWGLENSPEGARAFGLRMLDAVAEHVPVVKPQSAYFERFGWQGARALSDVVQAAKDLGVLVLLDAKRGDIGATNNAYAEAYLTPTSPLPVDALTVTAYTGLEALTPLYETAQRCGTGLFVLARSSNPEGAALQNSLTASGMTVSDDLLARLAGMNPAGSVGSVGCVVGATTTSDPARLDAVNAFILAPGLGAQGATAADLAARFRGCRYVLPSASRAISGAGPDPHGLRDRVRQLSELCSNALQTGTRA